MSFQPAHAKQNVGRVRQRNVAASQSFLRGALLLVDANGDYEECGADPANIAAVALSDYGTGSGALYPIGSKEFPPGKMQGALLSVTEDWTAEYVGSLPANPGGSYGVVKDSDGRWKVDFGETVATRVRLIDRDVTDSPLNHKRVKVSFHSANIQPS